MKIELPRIIFVSVLSIMKKCLDLGEFSLDNKRFNYFKKEVMNFTYIELTKLFKQLVEHKLIEKCPNSCSLRKGYQKCICSGSGYINKK